MLPSTAHRVPQATAQKVNEQIYHETRENILRLAAAGPKAINDRLQELDWEWDIERTLEANASTLALIGVVLGAFVSIWFLILPGIVAAFLLQHALQGWCPPVPIFRRLGFRTQTEIDYERYALKILRGDFQNQPSLTDIPDRGDIERVLEAVQR